MTSHHQIITTSRIKNYCDQLPHSSHPPPVLALLPLLLAATLLVLVALDCCAVQQTSAIELEGAIAFKNSDHSAGLLNPRRELPSKKKGDSKSSSSSSSSSKKADSSKKSAGSSSSKKGSSSSSSSSAKGKGKSSPSSGSSSSSGIKKAEKKKSSSPSDDAGPSRRPTTGCDHSDGKWVPDPTALTRYTDSSCPFIPEALRCASNGRPDGGYLFWRWQPNQCILDRFSPAMFLSLMRNKVILFAGDTFANTVLFTSLRCHLEAYKPGSTQDFAGLLGNKNATGFKIPQKNVNFTAIFLRVPFLTAAEPADFNMTRMADTWYVPFDWMNRRIIGLTPKVDVVVFSSGMWWNQDDRVMYKNGKPSWDTTAFDGYTKMIKNLNDFFEDEELFSNWNGVPYVMSYMPTHKPNAFDAPDTKCGYQTRPFTEGEESFAALATREKIWANALKSVTYSSGKNLRYLDLYRLSNFRPDGHPGLYGFGGTNGDCTNWCLPGVPDTWLDILYDSMLGEKVFD